jgi:hypothetical protein
MCRTCASTSNRLALPSSLFVAFKWRCDEILGLVYAAIPRH